ncbi:hypothetical protein [Flavobacterium luteum]|uniref:DUF4878 domain-containing protein n=1 Tax=Flavobacterium luteum TaxID=2026654 RepID=A0A7J5A8D1_9FLAO|nr:hypothetical protein [Flavobacterium luteum]KAB1153713.1 hypothetical protein F6464_14095 [Flavobacterium luteum]
MKKNYILILVFFILTLNSCSNSPQIKAESAVKDYLQENLNNPDSYCPISFSKVKTFSSGTNTSYSITHVYSLLNSDKDRVKMTVSFLLNTDFTLQEVELITINGDYGLM